MIFLRPASSRLLTASRSWTLPSPIVILPNNSRMVTSPTTRSLISNCIVLLVSFFSLFWHAALGHRHLHAALGKAIVIHLVHESPHIEDAAPGRVEEVIRVERVGQ